MLAEWQTYAGGTARSVGPAHTVRSRFLSSEGLAAFLRRATGRVSDPAGARRLELLERSVLESRVEQIPEVVRLRSALEARIVRSRPRLRGRRVDRATIGEILRTETDAHRRREAYYAEEGILRSLEAGVRRLAHLRNDAARELGFASFPQMRLGFEGLTVGRLRELARSATARAPARLRAFRDDFLESEKRDAWYPWDLTYARELRGRLPDRAFPSRGLVPAVKRALAAWGFTRDRLQVRVARRDLPFGGLTIVPAAPDDVRVLLPAKGGWTYYMVLFHEFGHAVHARSIRQSSHLLRVLDPGYAAFHEGIADLFEEIASTLEWLVGRPGIDRAAAQRFRDGRGDETLLRAVGMAEAVFAELDFYRDPDRDRSAAHHRRLRRVYGFGEFPARSFVDSFYVTHPVYLQSYLLALLFRTQVKEAILREVGPPFWPNRRVAPWLSRELFGPGARFDWLPRVEAVTGRPFGPEAFLASAERRDP